MIKCQCPKCKESFEAENEWIGQQAECPYCEEMIVIQPSKITPKKLSDTSIRRYSISDHSNENLEPKKSMASLILGIVGLLAWLIPLVGFPVTIIGLILGIRKKYLPGIILNIIGLVLTLGNSIWGAILGAQAVLSSLQ
jgi:DNA-directed RNA polymerase subunit RPC12/RpoP